MTVSIVELTNGISTKAWLCEDCQAKRRAAGWTVKASALVEFPCDDCTGDAAAPAAVDYIPTSRAARLPTEGECPRPKPMAPWVRPKAVKQAKEAA